MFNKTNKIMSLFDEASLVVTPNGVKAGKLYSVKPTDSSGDLDVVRATTATRFNSEGLIESVSANVPRLDYSNGSCPSILVEPQRTNLNTYSEDIPQNYVTTEISDTFEYSNSPNGLQTSTRLQLSNLGSSRYVHTLTGIVSSGTTYNFSCYYKGTQGETAYMHALPVGGTAITKAITFTGEWQRENLTFTAGSASNYVYIVDSRQGGDAIDFEVWGAQLEAGANATSYIPTVGSTVTRNADVISKTGISDLIGQTEGTMFVDLKALFDSQNRRAITLNDGTSQNNIIVRYSTVSNQIDYLVYSGNVLQVNMSKIVSDITNQNKIIVTYKNNECKLFVNGELINTDTSATMPTSLTKLSFDNGGNTNYFEGKLNNLVLWKTALTDQECINLTTI